MKNKIRPGMCVVHHWLHPCNRPIQISESFLRHHKLFGVGTVIDQELSKPFTDSKNYYWNIMLDDEIVEWREDLIDILN